MDINAALENMLALVSAALDNSDASDDATELAEQFDAIHAWLARGGGLPNAWW